MKKAVSLKRHANISAFVGTMLMSVCASNALAIDFKIDLPPKKGVATPNDEVFFDESLSVSEQQADSIVPESSEPMAALPSPVPPQNVQQRWNPKRVDVAVPQAVPMKPANAAAPAPQKPSAAASAAKQRPSAASAVPSFNSFPNLACLTENVAFWKRVYAEVDVNEALIHDRDDLDKVYSVVRLGGSESQRQTSIRMLRDHYRESLRSLAEKLDNPKSWDATERSLAKHFRPSELTRSRLLQASANLRLQQGLKSRFNAGVQRSLQYLPSIKSILRDQNLPLEIALLPHVESSFVNHAKSKVGAVGLWQLMPQTMQLLMGKSAVNRRTDPNTATFAAAKLLKQNFAATGSWPLALTAYNHGLGGVLRAVRSTSSNDLCKIIERYNSPSFRFASSNFYAQFLAARQISLQRYAELSKNREVGRIVAPLIASREKGTL
ncbi:MAG: hypothetical protein RLZZ488_2703 [Pseudomonadota bacterium]|jgi:hypothetical protein